MINVSSLIPAPRLPVRDIRVEANGGLSWSVQALDLRGDPIWDPPLLLHAEPGPRAFLDGTAHGDPAVVVALNDGLGTILVLDRAGNNLLSGECMKMGLHEPGASAGPDRCPYGAKYQRWRVSDLRVEDLYGDGHLSLLVTWHEIDWGAGKWACVGLDGSDQGSGWHPGHLVRIWASCQLEPGGVREVVLEAMDNSEFADGHPTVCFVVVKPGCRPGPRRERGQWPAAAAYRCVVSVPLCGTLPSDLDRSTYGVKEVCAVPGGFRAELRDGRFITCTQEGAHQDVGDGLGKLLDARRARLPALRMFYVP